MRLDKQGRLPVIEMGAYSISAFIEHIGRRGLEVYAHFDGREWEVTIGGAKAARAKALHPALKRAARNWNAGPRKPPVARTSNDLAEDLRQIEVRAVGLRRELEALEAKAR